MHYSCIYIRITIDVCFSDIFDTFYLYLSRVAMTSETYKAILLLYAPQPCLDHIAHANKQYTNRSIFILWDVLIPNTYGSRPQEEHNHNI